VGAMVNTEIFAQASKFRMTVKEVRVSHFPRRHGKPTGSNFAVISKAFRELIKMRRMLHTITPDQPGLFREHASGPVADRSAQAGELDKSVLSNSPFVQKTFGRGPTHRQVK
jgi:hypothetical protein